MHSRPCKDSNSYFNGLGCSDLHPVKCDSWNKSGQLMKNHCAKKCNFCGLESCKDDETFYHNGFNLVANQCKNIPKHYCGTIDRLGRRVNEYCRGLCNFCSL
mmetsp:Transcript_13202/g.29089  ORF Transcript_13202/g.29089 Transcript_13202/m.29089 type:complete len:102 (-) Transcript_13202:138-443(-)